MQVKSSHQPRSKNTQSKCKLMTREEKQTPLILYNFIRGYPKINLAATFTVRIIVISGRSFPPPYYIGGWAKVNRKKDNVVANRA